MHTWHKVALAGVVAYVGLVLYRVHKGQTFGGALLHPFGGAVAAPSAAGSGSTAVVLDLFGGASRRTKSLTNAF